MSANGLSQDVMTSDETRYEIDSEMFLALEQDFLQKYKLRYWYQQDKQILFIEYPSRLHETAVKEIRRPLESAMQQQKRESSSCRIKWSLDTNLDMSCGRDQNDLAIADLVVTDQSYAPYLVVEVAFAQSRTNVMAKAESWLSHSENIGVIVILISERPAFANPSGVCSNEDRLSWDKWDSRYDQAQAADPRPWGPVEVDEHMWVGKLSCTVEVLSNKSSCGPTEVIPPGTDTAKLDKAINGLFHDLVKRLAPSVNNPVDWLIDWNAFRQQFQEDISTHGYRRYNLWSRPPKHGAEEMTSTSSKKPHI